MASVNSLQKLHGDILVVEDNKADLKLISNILKTAGHTVRPASDSDLAFRSIEVKLPDLILLDINLPVMNGIEMCRRLKADPSTKDIPIIFISAIDDTDLQVKALEAGGADYVTKPIDSSEVLIRINTHISLYKMQQTFINQTEKLMVEIEERKRTEELLKVSEEKYRSLHESITDAVFVLDENMKYLMLNKVSEEFVEMPKEKMIGNKITDLFPGFEKTIFYSVYNKVQKTKKSDTVTDIFIHNDGRKGWYEVRVYPNEDGILCIAKDITDRKEAEHLLDERVKELNCLYRFSQLIEQPGISLEMILQGMVDIIPDSWKYPEIACARIELNGKTYQSNKCSCPETNWAISSGIHVHKKKIGSLAVRYIEEKPNSYDGPFCKEEVNLLRALADRLGRVIERHQTEKLLNETREMLSKFMESSTEGLMIYDPDFKLVMTNEASAKMINREKMDVIGKHIQEISPTLKNSKRFEEYMQVLKTGRAFTIEEKISLPGLEDRYFRINVFKAGNDLGVSFSDITSRKEMEKTLIESNEKFRDLYDNAPDMYVSVHARTAKIIECNQRLVEMLGYDTKDDIIGRQVFELYTPESAKTVKKKIFPEFKKNGIIEDKELQIQKKNGKIKDVNLNVSSVRDEKGNILHSRSSWRDITERKEAERRNVFASEILQIMNKSSERKDIIRHILEKIKEFTGFEAVAIRLKEREDFPYYSTSGFPGYFVEAEKYLCQRDADGEILRDTLGKPYLECMCGNILCGRTDVKYEFFTEGGSFWSNNTTKLLSTTSDEDRQTRTRNRCNSEGYESVALIPLRSENETIGLLQFNDSHTDMFNIEMIEFFEGIGYSIGIALSIKKTEEVLVDTKNQLYRSERLAATGRLAASIAHEINNPLQAMRSHIGIIEKNMPEDIPVQESIEQTNIGIDRIGHIVKQLLDLHREKNRAREFTDVNTVIESTLDMMKNQLDINKIVVKYDLRKHLPPVKADQQELVQVFMNMFINAQDAMYDGGELTINTRSAKQKVIIDIKDSGVGMTDDEMEHIFEPFFSTKEMSLGNGLGLSISKSIIDSYQGEITVNSEPGKGSKFTITLPLPKYQENKYE